LRRIEHYIQGHHMYVCMYICMYVCILE
jgi:hypothetical protein